VATVKLEARAPSEEPGPLGIPASDTVVGFQTEVFKELINKLAWALGSTYREPYRNQRTRARQVAIGLAKCVVKEHGYPEFMRK